jgi:Ran GTPase-activating protein (RanGAP) involved in mRNA processing and transport
LELEGNKLGPKTAREFGYLLKITKTLKFLDLDNNMLTNDGDDTSGLFAFIEALKSNKTLLSLNMANNRLDEGIGKAFEEALAVNYSLIDFEFGFNQFSVDTIRQLQFYLRRNKAIYDENQLREWNERRFMRGEDSALQQKYLKV